MGTARFDAGRDRLVLAALVAVGAVLRFYGLGAEDVWVDELITIEFVRAYGPLELVTVIPAQQPHLPAYYVLLDLWRGLIGTSPAAMRALSALFGLAAVPLIYLVGRRLFDARVGLLAAALLAISRFQLYYSQELRMYSMLVALALCSYYCFLRLDVRAAQAGYLLSTLLAILAHPFGLLVVAGQVAYLVALRGREIDRRQAALVGAMVVALVPVAALLYSMAPDRALPYVDAPGPMDVLMVLLVYFTGDWGSLSRLLVPPLIVAVALALRAGWPGSSFAAVPGFVTDKGRDGTAADERDRGAGDGWSDDARATLLVATWLAVPLAALLVVSYLAVPVFWARYTIVAAPAAYLLVGRGIAVVERRHLRVALAAVLIVGMVPPVVEYHTTPTKEQWSAVTDAVEARGEPGDLVIVYDDIAQRNYEYYATGDQRVVGVSRPRTPAEQSAVNETLREKFRKYDRVWLVTTHVDDDRRRMARTVANETHRRVWHRDYIGADVDLYVRENGS